PAAVASYVLRVRCAGGAHIVRRTWDDIVNLCTMLDGDVLARSAKKEAAIEFTPADVLAPDAASGFLKDLLVRPGMAWATPARRFLELEYLDGTLRGGVADDSRATAARQVASLAAFTTAAAAAAQATATATADVVESNVAAAAPREETPNTAAAGSAATKTAAGVAVAALPPPPSAAVARVLRSSGQQQQ
ncbi:unnamed protein product, partial [Ectocarpus sp. 12 AP-2014]